jgi:hypothetical protein
MQSATAQPTTSDKAKDAKSAAVASHVLQKPDSTTIVTETIEEEKQRLLMLSEISVILDTYDDIFSDFDPRPYDLRSLSDDFLSELRKSARQKGSKVELKIMVPEALRKPEQESIIKKRIKSHYRSAAEQVRKEILKMRKKGGLFILVGVSILTLAIVLMSTIPEGFTQTFMLFLLEPAGWFTIWTGFDYVFVGPTSRYDERDFYHKMSNSEISFVSY